MTDITTQVGAFENAKTMSSLEIAELTGKEHKHVLADIRRVLAEVEIDCAGFSAQYKDASGKSNAMFNLPRRECDLIVSGYAAKYRLAIIDRWHELEAASAPPVTPVLTDPLALACYAASLAVEKAHLLKLEQERMSKRLLAVEARQSAILDQSEFFSVMGFGKLCDVKLTNPQASGISRSAGKLSKSRGIQVGSIHDPRFGAVKTYHSSILIEIFDSKGHHIV